MVVRVIAYAVSAILGGLGLLYLLASASTQNESPGRSAAIGLVLLVIGIGIFWFTLKKAPDKIKRVEVTQKVDLAGDTEMERLKCKSCGGAIQKKDIEVAQDGSVTVNCPYCDTVYQITEKPKW